MLTTHLAGNYASDLYEHIKRWERYRPTAYYDSMNDPSQVTIGVGFNIEGNPQALNEVLRAFGFSLNPANDPSLSPEGRIVEQSYIDLIKSTITLTYGGADLPTRNALLQAELDTIMTLRASDERLPLSMRHHALFRFESEDESKTVFNALLPSYEGKVDLWLVRNGLDVKQPDLLNRNSKERIALVSLAYNSRPDRVTGLPTTLGKLLTNALWNDDRAEAWYEIRYNTNKSSAEVAEGIANRRYSESEQFSLYNPGPLTEADYKSAYRTFTRHRDAILAYERQYSPTAAGVSDINGQLAQAAEYLLAQYEAPGIPVSWENIYVGEDASSLHYKGMDIDGELYGSTSNDLIFGESGNDTLYGLAGDDILEGGADNDWLYGGDGSDVLRGGAGNDTYFFSANDSGMDRIEDSDNQGRIVFDDGREGPLFAGGLLIQTAPGASSWASADGNVTLTQGATWTLSLNSLSLDLGASFTEGDFGIALASAATPPSVVLTATDDQGSYLNAVSTAARRVDGGAGKDMVWGSPNADVLNGHDGEDWIYGQGGADRIDGGAGDDLISGFGAHSRVEGGAGADRLSRPRGRVMSAITTTRRGITMTHAVASLHSLRSLTFAFVAMLFTATACAESPVTPSSSSVTAVAPSVDLASRWLGTYDPLSRDGIRMKSVLEVGKSTFTWMDCNEVSVQVVVVTSTEFVFQVDPNAKCGWAGWIVALVAPSPESFAAIRVNAYRDLKQYQEKGYGASFPYSKTSK